MHWGLLYGLKNMVDDIFRNKPVEMLEHFEFQIPERNLFCAVLNRAIMDAVGEADVPKEHRKAARVWLFIEDSPLPSQITEKEFGTLFWYCFHLDLDWKVIVDYARSFINNPKKRIVLQKIYIDS